MIYRNKSLRGPRVETLVFPRDGEDIVFQAKAVLDYSAFDALCPAPEAQSILRKGESEPSKDINNPIYKAQLVKYQLDRFNWMVLESLSATEELKWETIDPSDPETWTNYRKELQEGGFNNAEIQKVYQLAIAANGVDDQKLEEAKQRFLALRPAQSQ